jgi:hypothetical protein
MSWLAQIFEFLSKVLEAKGDRARFLSLAGSKMSD